MTGRTNAKGGGGTRTFTGTYTLTNVTAGASPATFADGGSFSTTLTAAAGFELPGDVTLTMAGVTLTNGTHYDYSPGTGALSLSVPVRGDLALTVTATQIVTLYGPNRAYPHYAILVTRSYLEAPTYHVVWLASASATPDYRSWHVTVGGNYYAHSTGIRASSGFYKSPGYASPEAAVDAIRNSATSYGYNSAGQMNTLTCRTNTAFGDQVEYSSLTLYEYTGNTADTVTAKPAAPIDNASIVYLA